MSLGPLMVDIAGTELNEEEKEILSHPLVGGVILFSRNFVSREQIDVLVNNIKRLRKPDLLVAVDHEGGRVQRFRSGFTDLPPVGHLGRIYESDPKIARQLAETTGWLMAMELLAIRVDFSFAPVLDLDRGISTVIGDRAFHSDPKVVGDLASSYIAGMHRAGMNSTGKHFPGHGGVVADSHVDFPVDQRTFDELMNEDMLPFARMIHFNLGAVMPAHVIYPKVDEKPAGFSEYWLQEVLRKRMSFRGAIMSDDMSMKAASVMGDPPTRVRAAIEAGCDLVLVCNDPHATVAVIDDLDGFRNTPVSQMRLTRMRGRHFLRWGRLESDPQWKQAVTSVKSYTDPENVLNYG